MWLHFTDEQVWNLTPKYFKSQFDVHVEVQRKMNGDKGPSLRDTQGANKQINTGYIDQLPGW